VGKPQEKRVLVVDDEDDVLFFLKTALEDAGFQVDTASSVDEALERIRAAAPDCVSLDMVMPGKSGIVLFHELRRNPTWSRIPVIFVTAYARDRKVREQLDAATALAESTMSGPATYLEKPVTAETFVRAVAALLHVELEEQGEGQKPSAKALRQEIQALVEDADPDALRKALAALKLGRRGQSPRTG
jgi:CheY-like chemotaxis protein